MSKRRVILIHGIREYGDWFQEVGAAFEDEKVVVHTLGFDFVNVFKLLIPWAGREKIYADVRRKIEAVFIKYPDDDISIFAFSFGSYLATRAMLDNPAIVRPVYLILCGAITSRHLNWETITASLKKTDGKATDRVLNECGVNDPWPVVADAFGVGYGFVGTRGAGHPFVEDRFHDGPHATTYEVNKEPLYKEWARIVGRDAPPAQDHSKRAPRWFNWIKGAIWLTTAAATAALALAIFHEPIENLVRRPLLLPNQQVTMTIKKTITYSATDCVNGQRNMVVTTNDELRFSNYTETYWARWTAADRGPQPRVTVDGQLIEPETDECRVDEDCEQAWRYEIPVNGRSADVTWVREGVRQSFRRSRINTRDLPLRRFELAVVVPDVRVSIASDVSLMSETGAIDDERVSPCSSRGSTLVCEFEEMADGALPAATGIIVRHSIPLPACGETTLHDPG